MNHPKKESRNRHGELRPRVMISGYYGFDNLGDELILKVLTDTLKGRDIKITVLSNDPAKTGAEYGVDAIHRLNFIDIVDALTQTNLFISGGGGLFQDATGPMSALYYGGLIHLARFFEVPVCFWAQGVGPLNGEFARKMTAGALRQCETVIVRDEASAELVETISGVTPQVTADPVWMLKPPKKPARTARKKKPSSAAPDMPWRVGISLRPWPELTPIRLRALAAVLKGLVQDLARPYEFVLIPFQEKEDVPLLQDLAGLLDEEQAGPWRMALPGDTIQTLSECDVLLGMRFHSLILGILSDVAVYGLIYDPKVASLIREFDLKGTAIGELEYMQAADLQEAFNEYPVINLKYLKQQSKRNFTLLNRLLKIPDAELVR